MRFGARISAMPPNTSIICVAIREKAGRGSMRNGVLPTGTIHNIADIWWTRIMIRISAPAIPGRALLGVPLMRDQQVVERFQSLAIDIESLQQGATSKLFRLSPTKQSCDRE